MNWERRITSEAEVIKMAIAIEEDRLMCYFAIVLRSSRLSERIADLGARHASLQPPDETIDLAVCTVSHCWAGGAQGRVELRLNRPVINRTPSKINTQCARKRRQWRQVRQSGARAFGNPASSLKYSSRRAYVEL